jgi:hypothetical protein
LKYSSEKSAENIIDDLPQLQQAIAQLLLLPARGLLWQAGCDFHDEASTFEGFWLLHEVVPKLLPPKPL